MSDPNRLSGGVRRDQVKCAHQMGARASLTVTPKVGIIARLGDESGKPGVSCSSMAVYHWDEL